MSRRYNDLSALVEAASAKDCSVHIHLDDNGKPVYSVGSSDIGAAEFSCYFAALAFSFAALCALTIATRLWHGWRTLSP